MILLLPVLLFCLVATVWLLICAAFYALLSPLCWIVFGGLFLLCLVAHFTRMSPAEIEAEKKRLDERREREGWIV
jgi:fatty acid desaturase